MEPRPKILVVDDDPQVLCLLGEVLTQLHAEPRCVESSPQAAELIKREKFDGIILDWLMPGMSGSELAQRIRWSKSNSQCPIVMITGTADSSTIKKCFGLGVNFFLHKPISVRQLEALLNVTRGVMLQERRRYQRAPVQIPVSCQWWIQSLEQIVKGQSINLGATGILLKLAVIPPSNGIVSLKFSLPGDPRAFELVGRVVRVTPSQEEVGFRFCDLTKGQRRRLMEFVERTLASLPQ